MKIQTKTTWRRVKIGDLVSPVSETFDFSEREKIIFLNTSDVQDGHVLNHAETAVSTLPGQAKKRIKRGDILYSEIRPQNKHVARVNFDADNYVVSTKLMVLHPDEKFSVDFTYLALTAPRTIKDFQTIAESRSGTFPQITFDAIKEYEISIPSDRIQQQLIADVLLAYDRKIELNNKINLVLEEMAQAIFKEWFVKFRFPGYEKAEFVDSELGRIPKGWNIRHLGDVSNIVYGKDLPTRDLKTAGFTVYGGNGIIGFSDKYLFEQPQIIVGCRGAYSGNIFKTVPKSFITHNSLIVKSDLLSVNFMFYALKILNVKSTVTGSAQPQITINELNQLPLVIPPGALIANIEDILIHLENYREVSSVENQKLASLRDLLSPKLMSGEIRA